MATDGSGSGAATDQASQNSTPAAAATNTATSMPPPEQGLKCPRCDSPNTKFCYYNNYSLSQPRHFCKTCRRYWTKGGALRNVPVGGGCRKNKKSKSSALSRLSLVPTDHMVGNFSDPGSVGLQNLLSGPSQLVAAASDFQLGVLPFSRLHSPNSYNMPTNKYASAGEIPSHGSAFSPPTLSTTGLSYPVSSAGAYGKMTSNGSSHGGGGTIASSIESLSFINQDLHLKLQQQRMAMLFGAETKEPADVAAPVAEGQMQPISPDFGECGGLQKSWFAESSFALQTGASTGTDHVSRIGSDDGINNTGNSGNNPSYWNGAGSSGWNDMLQFTAMP